MQEVKGGFFRRIYAGLLSVLDNKMVMHRDWKDEPETIAIPFYTSMVGSERYMQDFYIDLLDHKSDGGNDIIPRGAIDLPTVTVQPANSVNRYVRAEFEDETDGVVQTFTANVNGIPLLLVFPCVVVVESLNDLMDVVEMILNEFFKVQVFDIIYKGMAVPVLVGFPDNVAYEKAISFGTGEDDLIRIKFDLAVETYLPSLDESTKMFRGNTMTVITNDIQHNTQYPTGSSINIKLDNNI